MFSKLFLFFLFIFLNTAQLISQEAEQFGVAKDSIDLVFIRLNERLKSELKSSDTRTTATAHLKLGIFCQENEVYSEAINQFNKAILLLGEENHESLFLELVNRLGIVHLQLKNYKEAENYFRIGLEKASLQKNKTQLAYAKSNLGTSFEKQQRYDEALKFQKESIELYLALKDVEGVSIVYENIGSVYEDLEQYQKALGYFQKSLEYHASTTDARFANILNNLGDAYRKSKSCEKGFQYTQKALEVSKTLGNAHEVASSHKDLAENFECLGNYAMSVYHLNEFIRIDKENKRVQNANQGRALQIIYDTKEKESRIQLLLQNSKIDRAQKAILMVSVVCFFIFIILGYRNVKKKRIQTEKEARYKQQLLQVELSKKHLEEENLLREVAVKNASLSRYSLYISQKNKMLADFSLTLKNSLERNNIDLKRKLKALIKEIDFNLSQEQEWGEFMVLFQETHPAYQDQINSKALEVLSPAEFRLSILLKLGLSSKEIASILRLTPDSVRVSRYRLRKKLPITSKEDLTAFLRSI